ncbi:cyclohexanone monooxygenase [Aulographum hederae CBS 113979]|uniref:Cyclohexanone monooxygenase n=1 Tax=Aulographum hederae CBS 113979 TaxID=1176131 RepID=A0A6G1GJN6_9PEZI|nr:cyclohexanone monooxygenase [Aulographum hederae CBS 113979]
MAHTKPWPEVPVGNKDHTNAAVVIIGGGISGICTAIGLIKRNNCQNFVILEKSGGIGGTWHDNKYPGCCCDVWSVLYSFSFEQNPDWTREYPGQEEILEYLRRVVEKYSLYKHIRFNTSVEEAKWDDDEKKWSTTVKVLGGKDSEFSEGYTIKSDYLVSAVGQLNVPRYPDIKGLDTFQGKKMHSARWDWSYGLEGKRIAVIGNGATAAQIVPEIAKVASQVTIYQRSPNWIIPRDDKPVGPLKRALFRYVPPLRWRTRQKSMDFREGFFDAIFDGESALADLMRTACIQSMHAALPDQPEMWKKLTPDYHPGCKRILITDDYYPALAKPHVDLETRKIVQVVENGIEVEDGGYQEFDMIVLATGFRTVEFMYPINIVGAKGRSIQDIWQGGAQAYNAVTVEDLPNFGMLYGPNSNLGHNSIILMIEAQSRYINTMIGAVLDAKRKGRVLSLKPKPEVVSAYNEKVQEKLSKSSFADPNCNSWYKNKEGRITNNWSGTVVEYQEQLSKVNWSDYIAEGSYANAIMSRKPANIGRVVEETTVPDIVMALSAVTVAAAVGGYLLRNHNALRPLVAR